MSRKSARKAWLSTVGLGVGIWGSGAVRAADPLPLAPEKPSDIRLIKQDEKKDPTPKKDPVPVAEPLPPELPPILERRGGSQGGAPAPNNEPNAAPRTSPGATSEAGGTASNIAVAANQAPQVLNATDLSQLLFKSSASTGVQFQQRNPLVNDPRVRGLRNTQFLTYGDGAFFSPVRLDLDTPVTRFDPGSVRDIIIVKGPYSVLYGTGHAVIDVATLDSPRFDCFEFHGRTALGYQTNGKRWDGLQSVWAGESNWGARITYNGLTGSDYKDGAGNTVPASYLSHNVNWAIGWDITDKTSVEFKGQRVYQQGLEFPGLYFDVQDLNTEAYTLRLTSKDQGAFDRFEFDAWYNSSVGTGNTAAGPKQAFVQQLLAVSFNPGKFNQSAYTNFGYLPLPSIAQAQQASPTPLNLFTDQSTTNFATTSLGYRTFLEWGKERDENKLIVGTDLRLLGQGLQENIRLTQVQGIPVTSSVPPGQQLTQNQSIPDSNSVNPGLFAQLEMPLNNRFTVRGGGRADWVRTSTGIRNINGNIDLFGQPGQPNTGRFSVDPIDYSTQYGTNPQTDSTRNFFLLAGFLQSEYKFTDEVSGVLSVGHSQRAPTLTELYASGPFLGVLQQGTSRVIGDPNLASEKLTQFDLGLRADYEWVQFGAGVFYGWINDYITYDQNAGGPGITQVVYTNTDLATIAGTELFGQMDVTTWLSAYGTMTYVQGIDQTHNVNRRNPALASSRATNPANGQYATDTEALPQIPPLESRVGFRIHDPSKSPKWQIDLGARMVASQNNVAKSLGELGTPGFTTFNIRTYWQASERLLLTAGVENLGNRFYREHLDPVSGTILGVNPLYRPGTNFYFGSQLSY
jgi:outer membrane receptor protein involved in Fe transport